MFDLVKQHPWKYHLTFDVYKLFHAFGHPFVMFKVTFMVNPKERMPNGELYELGMLGLAKKNQLNPHLSVTMY